VNFKSLDFDTKEYLAFLDIDYSIFYNAILFQTAYHVSNHMISGFYSLVCGIATSEPVT